MRNISGQQVENEQQWIKKCEQEHKQKKLLVSIYDISYIRWVTRTFHVVVVQKKRQRNVQEVCSRSRSRHCLALHDLIFLFE